MSKEQYDKLLEKLKPNEYPPRPDNDQSENTIIEAEEEWPEFPKYQFEHYLFELDIILESKIFFDGQFHPSRIKSYQINDLEEFVWRLCDKMHDFMFPIDDQQFIMRDLSSLADALDNCNYPFMQRLFGKAKSRQMDELKKYVNNLINNLQKSLTSNVTINEREVSDYVTVLFKKHIIAPEEAISIGVSKFLKLFGITLKPKAITMREYRRKKALPKD